MTTHRVLVTGATGFIGRQLVPRLVATGHDVCLVLRDTYASGRPLPQPLAGLRADLRLAYADLRNFRLTSRVVAQCEPHLVLHLAAAGVTDPFLGIEQALRHNLYGSLNLVRACFESRQSDLPLRLVVGRTPGEQSAMSPYSASKAAAWTFCRMFARTIGWPVVGATIYQAFGPGQPGHTLIPSAIAAALAGIDFPMTAGAQRRDWIHVDDVTDGLVRVLLRDLEPGTSIDIATGRLESVASVVETIYRIVGRGGRPLTGVLPDRPGEVPEQVGDSDLTEALIGWRAKISLVAGLEMTVRAAMQ